MSVQLVNDARRIAFYMEDDLHGIKQLAQAIPCSPAKITAQ